LVIDLVTQHDPQANPEFASCGDQRHSSSLAPSPADRTTNNREVIDLPPEEPPSRKVVGGSTRDEAGLSVAFRAAAT
jgi:hypothetical protein